MPSDEHPTADRLLLWRTAAVVAIALLCGALAWIGILVDDVQRLERRAQTTVKLEQLKRDLEQRERDLERLEQQVQAILQDLPPDGEDAGARQAPDQGGQRIAQAQKQGRSKPLFPEDQMYRRFDIRESETQPTFP